MRIPHIINKNTLTIFSPSPQTLGLIGENERKLVAENFKWDKNHRPSLEDLCVEAIRKYFKEKPRLNELPCSDRVYLLEILQIDLPLELIIPLIDDEYYWQRRYKETFGFVYRPKPKVWTWKSLYLERHVQKIIEEAQPQYNDEDTFDDILSLCNPYVTRLFVEELQAWKPPLTMDKEDVPEEWPLDHITFLPIFKKLNNIIEFDLVFGVKNAGENFKWEMFKITVADCQRLGRALLELKNLKILRIHRSNVDYMHCQGLLQGLIKHKNLEELDLSNCEIGDAGVLCVACFLMDGTNLKILNLANNKIGKVGSEGIGFAMVSGNCFSLKELDLKLNPLGTDGVMGIMRAIVRCTIPKKMSISACMFEEDTPLKICQMLKLNEAAVKKFDISANWFGVEGGEELVEAMSRNTIVEWLDTRETDISQAQQEKINEFCLRNRKAAAIEREEGDFSESGASSFVYQ